MQGFLLQLYKPEAARCKAPGSRLKEQWSRPRRLPRARGSDAKGDVTRCPPLAAGLSRTPAARVPAPASISASH